MEAASHAWGCLFCLEVGEIPRIIRGPVEHSGPANTPVAIRRVGLYVSQAACNCAARLDPHQIAARFDDQAAVARVVDDFHDPSTQDELLREVRQERLEAVVLAGEAPEFLRDELGGDYLLDELAAAGINPNLVGFASLREHCLLAHPQSDHEQLVDKAIALTDLAFLSVQERTPLKVAEIAPHRRVLVLGSGAAAVSAAYRLLQAKLRVTLIERAPSWQWDEHEQEVLRAASARLVRDPSVTLCFDTTITSVGGWAGDLAATYVHEGTETTERFGGVVVAVNRDYGDYTKLWPMLGIDMHANGSPLPRNRHTMAVTSSTEGVAIIRPTSRQATATARLQHQSTHGAAAALEVANFLSQPFLTHPVRISQVDPSECGLCQTCIKVCPFGACLMCERQSTSRVDERLCRGCGNCVVACPAGARDLLTNPTSYLTRAISLCAERRFRDTPAVLALLCSGCAHRAVVAGVRGGYHYPENVWPIEVTCGGRVDMQHVLEAFAAGFDGVAIGTCREGACRHLVGYGYLARRLVPMREILRSRRYDPDRLLTFPVSPDEGARSAAILTGFCSALADAAPGKRGIDLRLALEAHLAELWSAPPPRASQRG